MTSCAASTQEHSVTQTCSIPSKGPRLTLDEVVSSLQRRIRVSWFLQILEPDTMPPLPAELWIKILEFTLHLCQPADIPLYFPFIESARARQREKEQVAQDKAMLHVLNLVCRTWREMCLSFDSRRVHIQLEDMRSQAQSRIHASDCTTLSPRTVVLQISPPRSGMDPIQYAQVVEDTLAKAPSVRAVQISTGPHDSDTSVQHFLQVIQHVLSSLSKLSSLDLLSYHIFPLDIENVLSAVAGIPQLRAFRCNLEARKLPTTAPPLLPHLEILCISIDNLVSQEALEKWLRGWRMPCLTQLVNIGNWVRDDWSWILGLLEHNGTHLKALHLHVSLCMIDLTVKFLRVHLGPSLPRRVSIPSLAGLPRARYSYWRPNPR